MGATVVVIAQHASARPRLCSGYLPSNRLCDKGTMGPAAAPWITRATSKVSKLGARPHNHEASVKSSVAPTKSRTSPMRPASQHENNSAIALLTANDVMIHVPRKSDTARTPAKEEMDTLAMVVSSTCMNIAS